MEGGREREVLSIHVVKSLASQGNLGARLTLNSSGISSSIVSSTST